MIESNRANGRSEATLFACRPRKAVFRGVWLMSLALDIVFGTSCGRSVPRPSGADSTTLCPPHDHALPAARDPRQPRLDWNGDGVDDLALGGGDSVTIWFGSHAGLGDHPAVRLVAPEANSGFGQVLMPVGDLDADGFGDLVVAAPWTVTGHDRGDALRGGAVFLYRGGSGTPTPEPLTVMEAGTYFGSSVGVGDLDNDGHPELFAATPTDWIPTVQGRFKGLRGGVYVYGDDLVPHALWPSGPDVDSVIDVAGGADLDGDGCDDVVVRVAPAGAVNRTGLVSQGAHDVVEARVFTGGRGGIDAQRWRPLPGRNWGSVSALLLVPNFDGNNRAVVAFTSGRGVSVVRYASTGASAAQADLSIPVGRARLQVLATGDFDGDGRGDLVAASSEDIVAYRGGTAADEPLLLQAPSDARAWYRLAVGDFNGDGRDDLAATTTAASGAPDQLWIYRGEPRSLLEGPQSYGSLTW